jgi:cell volume regulation protein A
MPAWLILGMVGGLLVVAFLANRVFRITRIPDVVVLMALGLVLGPVLGLIDADRFSKATNLLGTLAIILVLFEGGLDLDLRETLRHFPGSLLLAVLSFVFSGGLVGWIVSHALGLPLTSGLLVGAVLGCTSSTIVLPVLQQMGLEEPVKVTLMLEASWGDVLAVLTVGLMLGMKGQSGTVASGLAHGLVMQVGVALIFAVTGGVLWSRLLRVLSEQRFWQVLTFSMVLVLYAGMEAMGANGLIAVLAFGLTLSNFPGIDPGLELRHLVTTVADSQQALLTFHSELAFLVRTFFFVLIGAVAQLASFREHPLLMAGTVAAIFFARWLAIKSSQWSWHEIGPAGRDAILWMLPRGLITVVLAIQATEARGAELSFLPGLAFAVILATNLLVVVGSLRGAKVAPVATASDGQPTEMAEMMVPSQPEKDPEGKSHHQRWLLDATLLTLLAIAGVLLWYGTRPAGSRQPRAEQWIQRHFRR